jgi:phytoene desaturase
MSATVKKNKKIIIIGAGFGGLTAAAYLAKAGHDVTVIEKNSWVGGRAQVWQDQGYTFDMGPSWYWMPEVFADYFRDFHHQVSDYYQLHRLDPSYRIYFKNEVIDLPAGREAMCALFEQHEVGAGKKLEILLSQTQAVYSLAMDNFVSFPYASIGNFFRPDQILAGLKILANYNGFQSVDAYLKSYFKNEKLVKMLSFPIFFLGDSTRRIPSVYSLMNHVDIDQGTWYPAGGFSRVAEAFADIARKAGVKIVLNDPVTSVTINDNHIKTVMTQSSSYPADLVISNADYYHTEFDLLPSGKQSYSNKYWQSRRMAPSALLIYLGLDHSIPGLLHHTLFFQHDWEAHNRALFEKPTWPQKPLYYVSVPTKTDPGLAPDGKDLLIILVPLASGLKDSETQRSRLTDFVVNDLAEKISFPLSNSIITKRVYALRDFEIDYHAFKGNGYGLGQTMLQTGPFRPAYKSKKVSNLYYTGQLTTPGIGVPLVVLSGKMVAQEIIKTYGKKLIPIASFLSG